MDISNIARLLTSSAMAAYMQIRMAERTALVKSNDPFCVELKLETCSDACFRQKDIILLQETRATTLVYAIVKLRL